MLQNNYKLVCKILLIAVVAVFWQGVLHEFLHMPNKSATAHHQKNYNFLTDELFLSKALFDKATNPSLPSEHAHCHNDHQACSSLSCSSGSGFIVSKVYTHYRSYAYELCSESVPTFVVFDVPNAFFRPPISSAV